MKKSFSFKHHIEPVQHIIVHLGNCCAKNSQYVTVTYFNLLLTLTPVNECPLTLFSNESTTLIGDVIGATKLPVTPLTVVTEERKVFEITEVPLNRYYNAKQPKVRKCIDILKHIAH
jgi:hypothetical protein